MEEGLLYMFFIVVLMFMGIGAAVDAHNTHEEKMLCIEQQGVWDNDKCIFQEGK